MSASAPTRQRITRPEPELRKTILFQSLAAGFEGAGFMPLQAAALAYTEYRSLILPHPYSTN